MAADDMQVQLRNQIANCRHVDPVAFEMTVDPFGEGIPLLFNYRALLGWYAIKRSLIRIGHQDEPRHARVSMQQERAAHCPSEGVAISSEALMKLHAATMPEVAEGKGSARSSPPADTAGSRVSKDPTVQRLASRICSGVQLVRTLQMDPA